MQVTIAGVFRQATMLQIHLREVRNLRVDEIFLHLNRENCPIFCHFVVNHNLTQTYTLKTNLHQSSIAIKDKLTSLKCTHERKLTTTQQSILWHCSRYTCVGWYQTFILLWTWSQQPSCRTFRLSCGLVQFPNSLFLVGRCRHPQRWAHTLWAHTLYTHPWWVWLLLSVNTPISSYMPCWHQPTVLEKHYRENQWNPYRSAAVPCGSTFEVDGHTHRPETTHFIYLSTMTLGFINAPTGFYLLLHALVDINLQCSKETLQGKPSGRVLFYWHGICQSNSINLLIKSTDKCSCRSKCFLNKSAQLQKPLNNFIHICHKCWQRRQNN